MRIKTVAAGTLLMLAIGVRGVSWADAQSRGYHSRRGGWRHSNSLRQSNSMVASGTPINVRLDAAISTDDVHDGDGWTGTVNQSVVSGNRITIPAGSPVMGVVTSALQGTHETQAQLVLAVRQVTVNGTSHVMNADAAPIVAGTSGAKKIGAVAIGAAAGALLGHTVARDNHGTLIGGLVGGAAGYGLTRHAFRTLQLKAGTVVAFTTRDNVMAQR
jgi:uncharacterized protein YqgC (DUF456 family)